MGARWGTWLMQVAGAKGVEDAGGGNVLNMLALQHLAEGGVIGYADDAGGELEGEMEIADQPGQAGAFLWS